MFFRSILIESPKVGTVYCFNQNLLKKKKYREKALENVIPGSYQPLKISPNAEKDGSIIKVFGAGISRVSPLIIATKHSEEVAVLLRLRSSTAAPYYKIIHNHKNGKQIAASNQNYESRKVYRQASVDTSRHTLTTLYLIRAHKQTSRNTNVGHHGLSDPATPAP